jgi:hypothetical protein
MLLGNTTLQFNNVYAVALFPIGLHNTLFITLHKLKVMQILLADCITKQYQHKFLFIDLFFVISYDKVVQNR